MAQQLDQIRAVVTLSGGLDSTANAAFAVKEFGAQAVLALNFDYGQRAARREREQSQKICQALGCKLQTVDLPFFNQFALGSGLLSSSGGIPVSAEVDIESLTQSEKTAKQVWVPNRNAILLMIAGGFAEGLGAPQVFAGFNKEEATTFADNSKAFMDQLTGVLRFSTRTSVRVKSYTVDWVKSEIVERLVKNGFSNLLDLVWSCYFGDKDPCGVCESCQRLNRARNGVG